ncbi:MAG TPA: hypothetical protein VF802_04645 [Candidatus Limnocylindrales bacterium]
MPPIVPDAYALGPLGAVWDFVDVRDVGGAVVGACLASRFLEPVLNVGSGRGHPAGDLVAAIAREVGFRGEVHEGDVGSPRSTDVPWQVADISRASDRLGWRPLHDLASMARSVVGPMRDVAG